MLLQKKTKSSIKDGKFENKSSDVYDGIGNCVNYMQEVHGACGV